MIITREQLKEVHDTLERYNKELELRHEELITIKNAFDEKAKDGIVDDDLAALITNRMCLYDHLMDVCRFQRAHALHIIGLYEKQQKTGS